MMPWEHVVVGYIGYSLFLHVVYRDSPTSTETLVVVFASVLPDLIDKPLAWEFGVFASGRALAHSIFFAIPVLLIVLWLAIRRGQPRIGGAFVIGYLLHLPADVVPKYLRDGEFRLDPILWPIRQDGGNGHGLSEEFMSNFVEYTLWIGEQMTSGDPDPYTFVLLGIGVFGILLWVYDGMPVGGEAYHLVRRTTRAVVRSLRRE